MPPQIVQRPCCVRFFAVLLAVFASPTAALAGSLPMYPLPKGADRPGHVVISQGVAEQDYFWLKAPYPTTPAVTHYTKVFSTWKQCGSPEKGWDSFGDVSSGQNRYLHQFVRYWISPTNDRAVTLLIQYQSAGVAPRKSPDDDSQYVVLVQHQVRDAAAFFASVDVKCR